MSHSYCRDVESYLCRRNDGHLIRIVGPAFELVCGWEQSQIPLSVVYQAIDRVVARREAKGGRRRPVRIEFCDADVLDLFDEWRRAVGVHGRVATPDAAERPAPRRRSLAAHLDQVITGLTAWRGGPVCPAPLRDLSGSIVDELDSLRTAAKKTRGEARAQLLTRLEELDRSLVGALRASVDESLRQQIHGQAERDLAPYRQRMPPPEYARSLEANADRLLRERLKLPRVTF